MTRDSERLLAVARRLVELCPAGLGSEIAVTGSVGAGLADLHSDVELLFLTDDLPEPEDVREWLAGAGATDVLAGSESDGFWAWGRLDGVELDPFWGRLSEATAEVQAITEGDVLDHSRLAFAHVLTHSIPLRTTGAFEELVQRCAVYPQGLGRRLIEDELEKWRIPAARTGAAVRGDVVETIAGLHHQGTRVLRIVFALNERWEPPRWKWLRAYARTLPVAPPRFVERVEEGLTASNPLLGLRILAELACDVLALLPPEIEAGPARRGLKVQLSALAAADAGDPMEAAHALRS